jgi:uncharacterized SAM-binding protein YcdF (DUF218 family)
MARSRRYKSLALLSLCAAPAVLPAVADALMWPIETRFQRASLDARRDIAGFIALGGGDERIIEAARLARAHPRAKLVITGHGDGAERLARLSGLPPERVLIEPAAQNTFENAQFTAALLTHDVAASWVLVTSASHMPRAVGCFRRAAVVIEAWPVADVTNGWRDKLETAVHEWAGLLDYWLRGRTDALFPAPPERAVPQITASAAASGTAIMN